jgi:hypothetical protein
VNIKDVKLLIIFYFSTQTIQKRIGVVPPGYIPYPHNRMPGKIRFYKELHFLFVLGVWRIGIKYAKRAEINQVLRIVLFHQ